MKIYFTLGVNFSQAAAIYQDAFIDVLLKN